MKLTNLAMATLMAMSVASFGANAATGTNTGSVHFKGEVVDTPCSLMPGQDGKAVEVDFGQLSLSQLNAGKSPQPQQFNIKLSDCNLAALKGEITFTGDVLTGNKMLKTMGTATGLGIAIDGVTFGTGTPLPMLHDGDNVLPFQAFAKAADAAAPAVTAGNFEATSTFSIAYK